VDQGCADLLCLEEFKPGRRTLQVSSRFRERNTILSIDSARALGTIAKTCLGGDSVHLHHVKELVGRFVDGWSINNPVTGHMKNSLARAFALAFDSKLHSTNSIMEAFNNGMQEGTDVLAYYALRRRPGTHRTQTQ
jgi:hypothetical protein